jgi:CHAD domain-containing protein
VRADRGRDGIGADRWLRHLEDNVPIARAGLDPEGAHQMRVAIARLRVWLALGGWRVLDDDLRWLRGRIAPVRDLDVQLQRDPPAPWAATLRRRRGRAQRELVVTLDGPRFSSLLGALACLPPVSTSRARREVPSMARRALRRARAASDRGYRDLESIHRLRCAVRRLRFALEWLGADAGDLARAQDALGEACDAGVALRSLAEGRRERRRRYRDRLVRDLRRARRRARAALRDVRPRLEDLACSSS